MPGEAPPEQPAMTSAVPHVAALVGSAEMLRPKQRRHEVTRVNSGVATNAAAEIKRLLRIKQTHGRTAHQLH